MVAQASMEDRLQAPFPIESIEWRIGRAGVKNGKPWAQVLAYVGKSALQRRMNEVFGVLGWSCEFPGDGPVKPEEGMKCRVTLFNEDRMHHVVREDVAGRTAIEPVKGTATDAKKRAISSCGPGMYLSDLGVMWAQIKPDGERGQYTARNIEVDNAGHRETVSFEWDPPEMSGRFLPTVLESPLRVVPDLPDDKTSRTIEKLMLLASVEKVVGAVRAVMDSGTYSRTDTELIRLTGLGKVNDILRKNKSADDLAYATAAVRVVGDDRVRIFSEDERDHMKKNCEVN